MTGTTQAGIGYLALAWTLGVLLIRYAVTGGTTPRHRAARRTRRVEVTVPAARLVPALRVFAYCPPCGHDVPVTVHDRAHRCDHGHLTTHTTQGDPK
ncbi:hypothetical protein [Streptomyces sp. bgisy154]|uniref:hypothetical protein n=1 Tax=Streptomyces sp. bgisy154 TaxID=3413794 RepID=UPI003D72B651